MKKSMVFILMVFAVSEVMAYGTGIVSYPWMVSRKAVTAELSGITSTGGGVGIQGRYTHKLAEGMIFDAGAGFAGGKRTTRIFVGADFEIIPDYAKQPKVSVKTSFENSKEFKVRRNILSVAPTVSKGFNFWGKEAFPFVSLPVGLSLDSKSKRYETIISANIGVSGNLPIKGYEKLIGTVEATIKIKDSYTGIFAGVTYPL